MHTLIEIVLTLIVLAFLVVAPDVIIFRRAHTMTLFRAARVRIPDWIFELAVALLTGLAMLGLLIILRRLAYSVASLVHYLWAVPQSYDGLGLKDRITIENDLCASRI